MKKKGTQIPGPFEIRCVTPNKFLLININIFNVASKVVTTAVIFDCFT